MASPGIGKLSTASVLRVLFVPSAAVAMLPLPGNMATLVWSTMPERAMKLRQLKSEDFCAMVNAAFRLPMVDIDYMHTIAEGQEQEFNWRMPPILTELLRV